MWRHIVANVNAGIAGSNRRHSLQPRPPVAPHVPLAEFIRPSPLLSSCGISSEQVEAELGRWLELGAQVARNLGFPPTDQLAPSQRWGGFCNHRAGLGLHKLRCGQAVALGMLRHY